MEANKCTFPNPHVPAGISLTYILGATLWENPNYVSPAAHRSALKKLKAGKYVARVQAKAAYEANRPTEPTYKVDPTDSVFDTNKYEQEVCEKRKHENGLKPRKKKKNKLSKAKDDCSELSPVGDLNGGKETVVDKLL